MKHLIVILLLLTSFAAKAQTKDSTHSQVIFFDDFHNNKNKWTIGDNKYESAKMDSGFYYLTSNGRAYGETQEIKIDTRKDFEIETRIKIIKGNADHKNYYSMLFWGREAMTGYYFTFAKDGFASVEFCDGKNQKDCTIKSGSLQRAISTPEEFNVYLIKKIGNVYSFFINGEKFYEMSFAPFIGNLLGFGAGRHVTLAVDYLKVVYL